jgi:hypothetical protein
MHFKSAELSHPILQEQRWQSLQELRHILSGSNDGTNSDSSAISHAALDRGADRTLCWTLSYTMQSISTVQQQSINSSNDHDRLSLICECLTLLWTRASHDRRKASVQQVPDALPWLLHVWQRFPHITTNKNNMILQSVVDMLRSWAKIKDGKIKSMLVQSGLIHRLQESLRRTGPGTGSISVSNIDHASNTRLSMLGLIKDLVFRANASDKECLYRYLSKLVLEQSKDTSYPAQEAVSAVLWNWAASASLGKDMTEIGDVWTTLEQYMSLPTSKETIPIHRNASSALGCVVAAWTAHPTTPPPRLLLEQGWVPACLLRILDTEADVDWRRRCMRTIRCLASCDWGRSFLWNYCESPEHFLNVLVQVLQNDTSNGSSDTRIQACQTISSLSPSAGSGWAPLGPYMEIILVQAIQDTASTDKLVLAASHTLHVSLHHSPWKRGNSSYTDGFFERIQTALESNADDASYHTGFSSLLLDLANNSPDGKSTLVCPCVLSTLAVLLTAMGPEYESSRRDALKIITLFMKSDCHKKRLAENEGLLTALVNFCLISSGPLKNEAKQVILGLVPEL